MGKRKSHVRLVHKDRDESFVTSPIGEENTSNGGILLGDYTGSKSRAEIKPMAINQYNSEGLNQ